MPTLPSITIAPPVSKKDEKGWIVSTTLAVNDRRFDVWYRSNSGPLADGVETFLAACVLPAMKLGYAIQTSGPVSAQLFAGINAFQRIMQGWYPELHVIPIHAEAKPSNQPRARGVGSFFSCGVDACYTMLNHHDEITAGILIHGFDYYQNKALAKETVSKLARQAAAKLNRPLIEVDTNIRTFVDQYADFATHTHGSILASVALLLSPQLGSAYIPSSYHYDELYPWGSHPETDRLWSTECTQVIHDDCDVTRSQKVDRIAKSEAALSVLRVCFKDYTTSGTAYNCGKCEKCIRTMMDLRIAGALDRCSTFRRSLRLNDIALIDVRRGKYRIFYSGSLKQLQKKGNDPSLEKALNECLTGYHYRGFEGFYRDARRYAYRDVLRPMLRPIEKGMKKLLSPKIHAADKH